MPTKDKFPDTLEEFLDSNDYSTYQLYTDNEYVLNSAQVKGILRRRKMRPLRNSCEYEPWQNPAERPWRTLTAASREFLLRGFGDPASHTAFDPHVYWPYTHQQAADVENALHDPTHRGRITHLRTPFCLAYAKTPGRYRDGKLAPQAEACVHLGFSRTKHGYVLEVIEGPRAGKVITSSQVKFRESTFPWRARSSPSQPADLHLWHDLEPELSAADDDDDVVHVPDLLSDSHGDDDDDNNFNDGTPSSATSDRDAPATAAPGRATRPTS
jgi:hypothetical protein